MTVRGLRGAMQWNPTQSWLSHTQRSAKQVVVGDGIGLAEILRLEDRRGDVINTIGFGFFDQAA